MMIPTSFNPSSTVQFNGLLKKRTEQPSSVLDYAQHVLNDATASEPDKHGKKSENTLLSGQAWVEFFQFKLDNTKIGLKMLAEKVTPKKASSEE